jgi:CRISPR-associated exonuclease Cas4
MFTEDDLLPISALQHLVFCERQCALIHLERLWAENRLTVEGGHLHERVHATDGVEVRGKTHVVRGLVLRSFRLGIWGVSDVVEFETAGQEDKLDDGALLAGWPGRWTARPVEYKRGKPKTDLCDCVQVGAHALCLEEMIGGRVREGSLFYGTPRRRTPVPIDASLREAVETAAMRLHAMVARGETPPARYEKKCDNCSLVEFCLPHIGTRRQSVASYIAHATDEE